MGESGFNKIANRYLELEPKVNEYLSKMDTLKEYLKSSAEDNLEKWGESYLSVALDMGLGDISDILDVYNDMGVDGYIEYSFESVFSWIEGHKNYLHGIFNGTYENLMEEIQNCELYENGYVEEEMLD
jgi:hypothetical protein